MQHVYMSEDSKNHKQSHYEKHKFWQTIPNMKWLQIKSHMMNITKTLNTLTNL